jgi:ABC-2 type transport system permease protein
VTSGLSLWIRREIGQALAARWFFAYAAVFVAGGLLLTVLGTGTGITGGPGGYGKGLAGLIQISLVAIPLMALFPAATTIADDRASGALEYYLAQPVTPGQVYVGKWVGVSVSLLLAISVGFGVAAAGGAIHGVSLGLIFMLYVFVVGLSLGFAALGLLLAALAESRARVLALGILLWLGLLGLGTLGLVTAFVQLGLPADLLVAWAFINPVEAFRLGALTMLDPDASLLGPVGATLVARIGASAARAAALVSLALWATVPALGGWYWFRRVR